MIAEVSWPTHLQDECGAPYEIIINLTSEPGEIKKISPTTTTALYIATGLSLKQVKEVKKFTYGENLEEIKSLNSKVD